MNKDEEYVRSAWRNVIGYPNRTSCTVVILTGSDAEDVYSSDFERTTKESAWSAAAEFTRDWQEQVRQLREEIALVRVAYQACFNIGKNLAFHDTTRGKMAAEALVWMRIIDRLDTELTRRTAGMKPEAL